MGLCATSADQVWACLTAVLLIVNIHLWDLRWPWYFRKACWNPVVLCTTGQPYEISRATQQLISDRYFVSLAWFWSIFLIRKKDALAVFLNCTFFCFFFVRKPFCICPNWKTMTVKCWSKKKKKKTNDHLFKSRVCQKYLHSKLSKYKISCNKMSPVCFFLGWGIYCLTMLWRHKDTKYWHFLKTKFKYSRNATNKRAPLAHDHLQKTSPKKTRGSTLDTDLNKAAS